MTAETAGTTRTTAVLSGVVVVAAHVAGHGRGPLTGATAATPAAAAGAGDAIGLLQDLLAGTATGAALSLAPVLLTKAPQGPSPGALVPAETEGISYTLDKKRSPEIYRFVIKCTELVF